MKAHKIELLIIAEDRDDVAEIIAQANFHFIPQIKKVETRDLGQWSDDHPLNKRDTCEQEYQRLFPVSPSAESLCEQWEQHHSSGVDLSDQTRNTYLLCAKSLRRLLGTAKEQKTRPTELELAKKLALSLFEISALRHGLFTPEQFRKSCEKVIFQELKSLSEPSIGSSPREILIPYAQPQQ